MGYRKLTAVEITGDIQISLLTKPTSDAKISPNAVPYGQVAISLAKFSEPVVFLHSSGKVETFRAAPVRRTVEVGSQVEFKVDVRPSAGEQTVTFRLLKNGTVVNEQQQAVPPGAESTTFLQTMSTTGRHFVEVQATQEGFGSSREIQHTYHVVDLAEITEGDFPSENGLFAVDQFDVSYTGRTFHNGPGEATNRFGISREIRVGAVHGRMLGDLIPDDAELRIRFGSNQITSNPEGTVEEFSTMRTGANGLPNTISGFEASGDFFAIDLERLVRSQSHRGDIQIGDRFLEFVLVDSGANKVLDRLQFSKLQLVELIERGLTPSLDNNPFPSVLDVDLLLGTESVSVGSFQASVRPNVLINNVASNANNLPAGAKLELTVDYGDGSDPKVLSLDPELKRDGGDQNDGLNDGLFGARREFLQHDMEAHRLHFSTVAKITPHTYTEPGEYTITVTATLPNALARDTRQIEVKSRSNFTATVTSVQSEMDVFAVDDDGTIIVAKSIPRVRLDVPLLVSTTEFNNAADPQVEIEILGQKQRVPLSKTDIVLVQQDTVEFDQIALTDFVDIKAKPALSEEERTFQATVTVFDGEEVVSASVHNVTLDVPSLAVEGMSGNGLVAHMTPGQAGRTIYEIRGLAMVLVNTSSIDMEEITTSAKDFFFLPAPNSDFVNNDILKEAFDNHFRKADGTVNPNTSIGRVRSERLDPENVFEVRAYSVVSSADLSGDLSQDELRSARESQVGVFTSTPKDLRVPFLSVPPTAEVLQDNRFVEGEQIDNLLDGIKAFNIPAGSEVKVTTSFESEDADDFTHVFDPDPVVSVRNKRLEAPAVVANVPRTEDGQTALELSIAPIGSDPSPDDLVRSLPVFVENVAPRVFAVADSSFGNVEALLGPLEVPLHPLASEAQRTIDFHVVRGEVNGQFLDPARQQIAAIREANQNAAVLLSADGTFGSGARTGSVHHVEIGEDQFDLAIPGDTTVLSKTFSPDEIRSLTPFSTRGRSNLERPLTAEVTDDLGVTTTSTIDIGSVITPISISFESDADLRYNLVSDRTASTDVNALEQDVPARELPTGNAVVVGERLTGLNVQLHGKVKDAANNIPGGEFNLTIDLGDGSELNLFRDESTANNRFKMFDDGEFEDFPTVPYDSGKGVIQLFDLNTRESLVDYQHVGLYRITASTDVGQITEEDGYGELEVVVLPKVDVETNGEAASGSIDLGELPSFLEFQQDQPFTVEISDGLADTSSASGEQIRSKFKDFKNELPGVFRKPGQQLHIVTKIPSFLDTASEKPVTPPVQLERIVVPSPKENIEEISVEVTSVLSDDGKFQQHTDLDVTITLPFATRQQANEATKLDPFVLTVDLGDGRSIELSRDDDTATGQFRAKGNGIETAPNSVIPYGTTDGKLKLEVGSGDIKRRLVNYLQPGTYTIRVFSECGVGQQTIQVLDAIPEFMRTPVVQIENNVIRIEGELRAPSGARAEVVAGNNRAAVTVEARPNRQVFVLEVPMFTGDVIQLVVTDLDLRGATVSREIPLEVIEEDLLAGFAAFIDEVASHFFWPVPNEASFGGTLSLEFPDGAESTFEVPPGVVRFDGQLPGNVEPGNVIRVRFNDGPVRDVIVRQVGNPCAAHPRFVRHEFRGNVDVVRDGADVLLVGDAESNGVSIHRNDQNHLIVTGLLGTSLNNLLDPIILSEDNEIGGDLNVTSLGDGDDLLCLRDFVVDGDVSLRSTPGDDVLLMSNVDVGGSLTIQLGEDEDVADLDKVRVGGRSELRAGAGNDAVFVSGVTAATFFADGGDGGDRLVRSFVSSAETEIINFENEIEPLVGDVDQDGTVDFSDFLDLAADFGKQGATRAEGDLNNDGVIAFQDFLILARDFGNVLEPALAEKATDEVFAEN